MNITVVFIVYILIAAITISLLISRMVEEFDIANLEYENFLCSCILQIMLGLTWPITFIGLGIMALTLLVFKHLEQKQK